MDPYGQLRNSPQYRGKPDLFCDIANSVPARPIAFRWIRGERVQPRRAPGKLPAAATCGAILAAMLFAPPARAETVSPGDLGQLLALAETVSLPDAELARRLSKLRLSASPSGADAPATAQENFGPLTEAQLRRIVGSLQTVAGAEIANTSGNSLRAIAQQELPAVPQEGSQAVFERVREFALAYTDSIPNFTCIRTTEIRSSNKGFGEWKRERSLDERISVEGGRDRRHTLRTRSQRRFFRPSNILTVTSEFGQLLGRIFSEKSQAMVAWSGILPNGRWLLGYRVKQQNSTLRFTVRGRQETAAYDGYLEVEPGNGRIHRMSYRATNLPEDFSISGGEGTVAYGGVEIEAKEYHLPVSASMVTYVSGVFIRNEAVYSAYRKFEASSDIRFEPAAEVPLADDSGLPPSPPRPR